MNVYKEKDISKVYQYKEVQKDKKTIEYGWVEGNDYPYGWVILSTSLNKAFNSCASLDDYAKYFKSYTGMTSQAFLAKWWNNIAGLEKLWYLQHPKSERGTHQFLMNLANLIENKSSFTHQFSDRLINFEALDVEDESREEVGNEGGEVSGEAI